MSGLTLQRRQVLQSLIAISAVGGLGACVEPQGSQSDAAQDRFAQGYFTNDEMVFIAALADTIIPQTETAGAAIAGVPNTIQDLATNWGNDEFKQYWREGLAALDAALTSDTGDGFVSKSPTERETLLSAYDGKVYAGEIEDGFYRDFKATLLEAYYMSEPGATQELAYEPVPGEWIACAPISEFPKTWAT
jgi:gluconate 2-dehydrogenase gamma chain